MAVTAFSLGGAAKLAQKEGQDNTKGNGFANFWFTAQSTGVAVVAIASGGCGYFCPTIKKGNDLIANSWHNKGDSFGASGYDWYEAHQYAGGFATKTLNVKKGDVFCVYGGAGNDGGGAGMVSVNFFVVK